MSEERSLRTVKVIFLFTAVICFLSTEMAAFAAEKVDQSNLPPWGGGWTHINPDPNGMARMWQTFTPEYSNIKAVQIDILTVNAGDFDDIITVEIAKDGETLASTERLVEYGYEGLLRFEFAETVSVIPGELYELRVRDTGLTRFGWKYASNTYERGTRYVSATERSGTDWFFQTYSAVEPRIIYVDDDAAGANDGTSWENAYVYLQDALADANSAEKPVEIRVAQGIYKPDQGVNQTPGDRTATFRLINGVTLKGGYAGAVEPNTIDIELYETILSGDLSGNDIDINDPVNLYSVPNRYDNSSHVVKGSNTNETSVLDGFTISGGYIWVVAYSLGGGPSGGAGMLISSGSPTLIDCTFTDNVTGNAGGGLLIYDDSNPTLLNCKFTRNNAESGGGIFGSRSSSPTLINCIFSDNYAKRKGGGMYIYEGNPKLTNCTFDRNSAPPSFGSTNKGGGMYTSKGNPVLTNCTFSDNMSDQGGAIYNDEGSNSILTECNFLDNYADHYGGAVYNGAEYNNYTDSNLMLTQCVFKQNSASQGGAMEVYCPTLLTDCTFTGNSAAWDGGAISVAIGIFDNCIFTGNRAIGDERSSGGAVHIIRGAPLGMTIEFNKCTFNKNWAELGCAISRSSTTYVNNCIFWGSKDQIRADNSYQFLVDYSDIQGGWQGEGNIDADPCFADPGYWADADDPNIVVEPNDPNAVWVDGDYHLKSHAGRWDPVSQSWVQDDVTSPCIDAGDPNNPVRDEPEPNGSRINMGAYGGTAEASKSDMSELFQTMKGFIRSSHFKAVK